MVWEGSHRADRWEEKDSGQRQQEQGGASSFPTVLERNSLNILGHFKAMGDAPDEHSL